MTLHKNSIDFDEQVKVPNMINVTLYMKHQYVTSYCTIPSHVIQLKYVLHQICYILLHNPITCDTTKICATKISYVIFVQI